MTDTQTKKPKKKKSSKKDTQQKVVSVDPTTHEPTVTKPSNTPRPDGKDLLPHALHKQIQQLKTQVENLEVLVQSLINSK